MLEPEALEDFVEVDQSDPNAVVIGLAPSQFDYDHLNRAFRILQNEDNAFIAIHKSKYFKKSDGLVLGPG